MNVQLERLTDEREKALGLVDEVTDTAATEERDLVEAELELVKRQRDRVAELDTQIEVLSETEEARARSEKVARSLTRITDAKRRAPAEMEYRNAGHYVSDVIDSMRGDTAAAVRLERFLTRTAEDQTTTDNPGVIPDPILGPVIDFIDARRPLVAALGVRGLPSYPTFHRPHVTQHTSVAKQAAEKAELASQKMTIERLTVTAETYGGYVDISLQNRDFSSPSILQIIINDLAGQYAIQTETAASTKLATATTQTGTAIPAGTGATAAAVAASIFDAAGKVYAGVHRLPNVVFAPPDMWGLLGPLFPNVNPQNSISSGMTAGSWAGSLAGLQFVVAPHLPSGKILVGSTDAFEVYEQRVGALQVLNASVLGVDVAYAGYFASLSLDAKGFASIAQAASA